MLNINCAFLDLHVHLSLFSQTSMPCTFRGGNVPFRRLCASFGAEASMSEMSYARNLVKGNVVERTHLRQAANEDCFGEQH